MGHFGISSCDNDTSWDVLSVTGSECGFPENQLEANALMEWIGGGFLGESHAYYQHEDASDTVLGPVIWLLREGFTVEPKHLKYALAIARERRVDNAYLDCWVERAERYERLGEEILMLKKAIAASGS